MALPPSSSSSSPSRSAVSRSSAAPRPPPPPPAAPARASQEPRRRLVSGLRPRTTLTLLAVGLVPIALFGGAVVYEQSQRVQAEAELSLRTSGERIAAQVDEWFDKSVRVAEAAANLPAVTGMRGDEQTPVLVAIARAYPWVYLAHVIGPDGKNTARSDGRPMADYPDRQYFRDVMAGHKAPRWEVVIGKTSGKPAVILAVPIVRASAVVGVLTFAMTVEDVSKIIAHWKMGQTGYAFLTDEQAKVVAHPREEFVTGQIRLAEHPLVSAFRKDGQPHGMSFLQTDGREALGYVQGNRWGWAVAIQRDRDELYAPVRRTLALGAGLLVAVALLVALAARAAAGVLVRPIVEMTQAADRMSMGDLEAPIPAQRIDELSALGRSLERLRISLRAAMARLRG